MNKKRLDIRKMIKVIVKEELKKTFVPIVKRVVSEQIEARVKPIVNEVLSEKLIGILAERSNSNLGSVFENASRNREESSGDYQELALRQKQSLREDIRRKIVDGDPMMEHIYSDIGSGIQESQYGIGEPTMTEDGVIDSDDAGVDLSIYGLG